MSINGNAKNHIDLYNQNGKLGSYNINDNGFANVDLLNTNFTYAKLYVGGSIVNLTRDANGKLVLEPNSK